MSDEGATPLLKSLPAHAVQYVVAIILQVPTVHGADVRFLLPLCTRRVVQIVNSLPDPSLVSVSQSISLLLAAANYPDPCITRALVDLCDISPGKQDTLTCHVISRRQRSHLHQRLVMETTGWS